MPFITLLNKITHAQFIKLFYFVNKPNKLIHVHAPPNPRRGKPIRLGLINFKEAHGPHGSPEQKLQTNLTKHFK